VSTPDEAALAGGVPAPDLLDRWLAKLPERRGQPPADGPPSLLIGGPVRCGKSSVAQALAERTGMVVWPTDVIDRRFCRGIPDAHQHPVLAPVLTALLLRHPRGLILEGVQILERARWVVALARARGHPVHAIGYARGRVEDKLAHLRAHRATGQCWTLAAGLDDAALRDQAAGILDFSRELRALAPRQGFAYHELDSGRFADEVQRVAGRIAAGLDRPAA